MKKLLIISFFALSLTAMSQNKSVAILNPLDREGSVSSMYKIIVRSSFETVVSATQGYEAFDRTALDAIMSEHNFQRSGAVNDAEIRQIGEMTGVDYVLVTEVSAENEYMVVQAKILNVVTAKYDRAVDDLMQMTPPTNVKEKCTILAEKLFCINMQTGNQKGEIIYKDCKYVGEYKEGKPNGKGKIYLSENDSYEGEWSDGTPHGYGMRVTNDSMYKGLFEEGLPHGNGIYFGKDGTRIEGTFVRGTITDGTYFFSNGDKYVGHLMDLLPHGNGSGYFSSGDKYVGTWKKGKKDGKGTYYFDDGKKYVGSFSNDIPNGEGTLYLQNGLKFIGTWVNGVMQGIFLVYMSDGTVHHTRFVDNEPVEVID